MKKILIVEDDPHLLKSIKQLLEHHNYITLTASDITGAMHYVLNYKDIDLFLLDVWLFDGDGFELCQRIRKYSIKPVIFLTACDDEESVVKGLNLGGDDYITKPFRTAELLSRIGANLRRQNMSKTVKILQGGEIKLDLCHCTVYKNKEPLNLGTTEYQLLAILMQNAGRILKREQIIEKLWDTSGNSAEDNTLSVNMSRLRRKTGAEYIETIRGFGYRFTKTVTESLES